MNRKKIKHSLASLAVFAAGILPSAQAETLTLFDDSFSISGAPTSATILAGRWGIWNGTSFIQAVTSIANVGYVDLTGPEMQIELNQIDNSVYAAGTQMALALYGNNGVSDSQAVNFATAAGQPGFRFALFTDSSWTAPTFGNNATSVVFSFSANTTGLGGTEYNFNDGNQQITMVPEPSTYALLALGGLALGGYFLRRRRCA